MKSLLNAFVRAVDRVTATIGRLLTWLPLTMALLMALVVVVRHAFDSGSIALQETVMYTHGLALMLGIGYTLKHDGHVRVDLLYARFTPRTRRLIDTIGHLLLLLPLCATILWVSLPYVAASWRVFESSPEVGGIPGIFLLKTLLPATAIVVALQGLAEVLRLWLNPLTPPPTEHHEAVL